MTSEQQSQQITSILNEAEAQDDPRGAMQLIRQKIAELNDRGEHVPDVLVRGQKRYADECIHASQGR